MEKFSFVQTKKIFIGCTDVSHLLYQKRIPGVALPQVEKWFVDSLSPDSTCENTCSIVEVHIKSLLKCPYCPCTIGEYVHKSVPAKRYKDIEGHQMINRKKGDVILSKPRFQTSHRHKNLKMKFIPLSPKSDIKIFKIFVNEPRSLPLRFSKL